MATPTEKRIIQERKTAKTGAVLVPILENLLEEECIPEDEEDFEFIDMLMRKRAEPRAKGVYSPSMLGSCVRQAYFAKRGERKVLAHNPQTNGYFLKGNFIHFQWQFALWKAHRKGLLDLIDVEMRVGSGDFWGTIDGLVAIDKIYVVDFKGINLIDFQRTVKKGAPQRYRKQLVGYAKLLDDKYGVDTALLISECKAGPVSGTNSPLALHETRVDVAEFDHEVTRRLKTLHWYDDRNEVPEPECVSTLHTMFQECPFSRHCHEEVRAVQRVREGKARKSKRDWSPARPER